MTDNKRKAERLVRMLTDGYSGMKAVREVIDLLEQWPEQALKQQAEPVADCPRCGHVCSQREWVGLTDEDWAKVADMPDTFDQGVGAIEAKLKERNT